MFVLTSRPERIEQAICFGHSPEWIRAHIGATDDDITAAENRIDAARRNDNAQTESGRAYR